ncbi:AraC family transcriptional regulator [Streptomyces sp. Qhu-G9]|uniref:AraC family transcriptional regulator n=1 Tax=Streptomyces sp. Qhu-G9 TaxID=3452799 RepID=UPI0022ABC757|nr:AraC family transcriptional regulator [Streptomyces aurantiacus]WAU82699.1 AraC family transcriptional regulator [Streptomyces aurantiacus]
MDLLTPGSGDPLTDLLNSVRTTGAIISRSSLSGAWALRFEDGSPMALTALLRGAAWVIPQGGEPVRLGAGDVAVLSGGAPYVIADDPATEPDVVVGPGGRCTSVSGGEVSVPHGVEGWGTAQPEGTVLVNGLYTTAGGIPGRLRAALPPLAAVQAGQNDCPTSSQALENATRKAPGQQVLLDRMLDLMLITALRAWFTRLGAPVPGWYRAHSDPVVGTALRLLHADPAHPWTVETLAARTGASRAALARRFTELLGQPPMTYLRQQRIALAADLLREPGTTIGAVAARVGFSNAFALSTAFKKERGISPSDHRTGTAAG